MTKVIESSTVTAERKKLAVLKRGILLQAAGRFEDALQDFTHIVESTETIKPCQREAALFFRGALLIELDQIEEGIAVLNQIIESEEHCQWKPHAVLHRMGGYRKLKRLSEALADCERYENFEGVPGKSKADVRMVKAVLLIEKGETAEGQTELTKVIDSKAEYPEISAKALCVRASYSFAAERYDESIIDVTEAIDHYSTIIERSKPQENALCGAILFRSSAYLKSGRIDEAIADCERIETMSNASDEFVFTAIHSHAQADYEALRLEEAITGFTRAIEFPAPPLNGVARALLNRAAAYHAAGRESEANADNLRILTEFPDSMAADELRTQFIAQDPKSKEPAANSQSKNGPFESEFLDKMPLKAKK